MLHTVFHNIHAKGRDKVGRMTFNTPEHIWEKKQYVETRCAYLDFNNIIMEPLTEIYCTSKVC